MTQCSTEFYIPLRDGGGTIVDWNFQSIIHCFNWHEDARGYVRTNIWNTAILMHRLIKNFPRVVDHKDGNIKNNTSNNLRNTTQRKNTQNQIRHRNGNLVGANYDKHCNKWISRYRTNYKRVFIGKYDTELEAHLAYKMYGVGLE